MDIEELSKTQIVLLTLLVAFVTSMATGIVTVSMMGKAPPSVAETVNRVIEQTVQTVDPAASQAAATVVTQQKTVTVDQSDMVAQALQKLAPSIVRLYSDAQNGSAFLGLGFVMDNSGTVMTDIAVLGGNQDAVVKLADGSSALSFVTTRDAESGIAYLSASTTAESAPAPVWVPAAIANGKPMLGESVVAVDGENVTRIGEGIVTAIVPQSDPSSSEVLDTDIPDSAIMYGSPLIDTAGEVIGVSTQVSRTSSPYAFIPLFSTPSSVASSTKETANAAQ